MARPDPGDHDGEVPFEDLFDEDLSRKPPAHPDDPTTIMPAVTTNGRGPDTMSVPPVKSRSRVPKIAIAGGAFVVLGIAAGVVFLSGGGAGQDTLKSAVQPTAPAPQPVRPSTPSSESTTTMTATTQPEHASSDLHQTATPTPHPASTPVTTTHKPPPPTSSKSVDPWAPIWSSIQSRLSEIPHR